MPNFSPCLDGALPVSSSGNLCLAALAATAVTDTAHPHDHKCVWSFKHDTTKNAKLYSLFGRGIPVSSSGNLRLAALAATADSYSISH